MNDLQNLQITVRIKVLSWSLLSIPIFFFSLSLLFPIWRTRRVPSPLWHDRLRGPKHDLLPDSVGYVNDLSDIGLFCGRREHINFRAPTTQPPWRSTRPSIPAVTRTFLSPVTRTAGCSTVGNSRRRRRSNSCLELESKAHRLNLPPPPPRFYPAFLHLSFTLLWLPIITHNHHQFIMHAVPSFLCIYK